MDLQPIGKELEELLTRLGASNTIRDGYDEMAAAQHRIDIANSRPGKLEDYDCPVCRNKGYVLYLDPNGYEQSRKCECADIRHSRYLIRRSGLQDVLDRYTFDAWQTQEEWQMKVAAKAREYASRKKGWLLAAGRSGSGKTHLCTAICNELLQGGVAVQYVRWRTFSTRAKALVNDEAEYFKCIAPLEKIRCLYIDDFFKSGAAPTTADINLAYEIINARYDAPAKLTIISTECSIGELMSIDEAIGGRILERSEGFCLDFFGKPNWRMK